MSSPPPVRRFKVEPVETGSKSSRRFAPEPVETSAKTTRKFAAEPIETTSKIHRKFAPQPVDTSTKTTRKFAPQPVETSTSSSRNRRNVGETSNTKGKFSPQPVETSSRSSRNKSGNASDASAEDRTQTSDRPPRRKFAPQLIETAKRTRKSGDTSPAILPSDKTEATPDDHVLGKQRPGILPAPPDNTPATSMLHVPQLRDVSHLDVLEARRIGAPLDLRKLSTSSARSHSFRCPELETIESSESEEGSNLPSLSTSPSTSSDHSYMYKHATRLRESVDDRVSGYLLEIAARAAEKQLREQAMAAFPNSDFHEPVDHYIDRDTDERSLPGTARTSRHDLRFTQVNWELKEMRERQEQNDHQRYRTPSRRESHSRTGRLQSTTSSPWASPTPVGLFAHEQVPGQPKKMAGGRQREIGIEHMRAGARPPMLGGDIEFLRCPSPEPARFDVTQGSHAVRESMCYLTGQANIEEPEGLWQGKATASPKVSLWSTTSSRRSSGKGLWNGYCFDSGLPAPRGPSGLLTPSAERGDPVTTPCPTPTREELPPSPPPSNPDFGEMASLNEKLMAEQAIDEEFDDAFVTQVYNYLSLGYPSLARKFDGELSRISGTSIADLRQDDALANARGYIRFGDDEFPGDLDITEYTCARWTALRLYIREWAKQQPNMMQNEHALGGFGVSARRGSWAW